MMTTKYFHFTIGPVQGFISQARRTRDFWTGSFILSWLAAVAMNAVLKQDKDNNKIIFPKPDKHYLDCLEGDVKHKKNVPTQGGVPNRFKAEVSYDFKPELVVESVQKAWQALADKVYEGDLASFDKTGSIKTIWDKQIESFWDISWVLLDKDDASALDVRKNWRSYHAPEQGGVKCMMMEGWQELSGAVKPGSEVTAFWKKLRNRNVKAIKTDLREGESLSAIAFIKRRFPRYFQYIEQVMPSAWTLTGWDVKAGRPSVAYMAAVHWLEQVLLLTKTDAEVKEQLERFYKIAIELTDGNHNEWDNQIECIKKLHVLREWKSLDGNVFFESALENKHIYTDQDQANAVLRGLKDLQILLPDNIKLPSPFYAVLVMDGDSLGKQMSEPNKQDGITNGLKAFTDAVPDVVKHHNGFLIYAGGDDVLALLPVEDALSCALAVRQKYEDVFKAQNLGKPENEKVFTTISAAVLFAHIKTPLGKVLKGAHDLLDNVAKEKYGRDALAVSVWKPGGEALVWGRPWDAEDEQGNHLTLEDDENGNKRLIIKRLADDFAKDDKDGQLSNRFLYKIRERFELLNPPPKKKEETERPKSVLSDEQAIDLMAAEYVSSGLCDPYPGVSKMAHAKAVVAPLLTQCQPVYRILDANNKADFEPGKDVLPDAALLVRFLAQKGVMR